MSDSKKQHGAFSWNELMTIDVSAAKIFYGSLFHWTLEDMQTCDVGYTMAKAGDTEVAGIMATPPEVGEMPPMWGSYVTVDDVDASAKLVESLGGNIVLAPRDIPGVGRFCVIADPQGAVLSIITYFD
ncbi:Glyoxalase/bleomycin resistance protein/dioxygenase [hydrothermal vent metagenome]|uniref:Glyoxalase/bleomycin resistance protein/dioxygenase n=1 Tax=hydrothermal vent metagenome TaxID=652676 RepID=A0A3B0Y1W0_9ZZZZ